MFCSKNKHSQCLLVDFPQNKQVPIRSYMVRGFELNNLRMRIGVLSLRASLTSLSHVQERQPRIDLGCYWELISSSGCSIS